MRGAAKRGKMLQKRPIGFNEGMQLTSFEKKIMAKQVGPLFICGSYGNACFYKCNGQYYMRSTSSLSGKRVKRDPKFAATMQYASWMGEASIIASGVYRKLYAGNKNRKAYQLLTGKAMCLLKEGKNKNEIVELLYKEAEDLIYKAQLTDSKFTVSKKRVHLPETITIKSMI